MQMRTNTHDFSSEPTPPSVFVIPAGQAGRVVDGADDEQEVGSTGLLAQVSKAKPRALGGNLVGKTKTLTPDIEHEGFRFL
jgi:hypothetical protein